MPDNLPYPQIPVARLLSFLIAGIVAVILMVIVFSAWRSIHPGYVGIVFDKANHNVTTGALDPG